MPLTLVQVQACRSCGELWAAEALVGGLCPRCVDSPLELSICAGCGAVHPSLETYCLDCAEEIEADREAEGEAECDDGCCGCGRRMCWGYCP